MGRTSNGATCGSTKATIPCRRLSPFEKKDADMNNMTATLKTHPLAVGSDGYKNFLFLEGKVNSQSSADDHESVYNVKFTTTLGFTLTMGYSRYKDQVGTTHAWIAFGEFCSSPWQKELGVDLLLNLVGYRCVYGSSATAPPSQPLAGGASSVAPPSQPLAGFPLMQDQAKEQEDEGKDETDHEGLDVRPCLGEQDTGSLQAKPLNWLFSKDMEWPSRWRARP